VRSLLDQADIDVFVHGNFTQSDALDISKMVRDVLKHRPLFSSQIPEQRVVRLQEGTTYVCQAREDNKDDVNSCTVVTFQIGGYSVDKAARLDLIGHLLKDTAYNQLRTVEQLGYLVWSFTVNSKGVLILRIVIQSSSKSPEYLDARIEAFLDQYREQLTAMDETTFATNRAALAALKEEKDKTLRQESMRHWTEINSRQYLFNRNELEAAAVRRLKLPEVVGFWDLQIRSAAPNRRKFVTQIFGKSHTLPATAMPTPPEEPEVKTPHKHQHKDRKAAAGADSGDESDGEGDEHGGAGGPGSPGEPGGDEGDEVEGGDEKEGVAPEPSPTADSEPGAKKLDLRPAPVDASTRVYISDFTAFRRSQMLYPNMM